MIGSCAWAPAGSGQPGAFGKTLPFAAYQSAGKALSVIVGPMSCPVWNGAQAGFALFGAACAAAVPVERTARLDPASGPTPLPKPVRIDRDAAMGAPAPFALKNPPEITPHVFSGSGGLSLVT